MADLKHELPKMDERLIAFQRQETSEATVSGKAVKNYKRHAKKIISEKFASIVTAIAKKAAEGSLAHTKYLFELGCVKEEIQRQKQGKKEPSLAQLLIAEVRRTARTLPVPQMADPRADANAAVMGRSEKGFDAC